MDSETRDPLETTNRARASYELGLANFERGRYRDAIANFEAARNAVPVGTALGGDVQVWLVTAYEAIGDREAALKLCRKACHHPSMDARKHAKRLLAILEAPQLVRRPEWMTSIPDLSTLDDLGGDDRFAARTPPPPKPKPPENPWLNPPLPPPDAVAFDGRFVWGALIVAVVLTGILAFV